MVKEKCLDYGYLILKGSAKTCEEVLRFYVLYTVKIFPIKNE